MDIGNKLKLIRISQNLTQDELAKRSELTKGFISQVERNLTSPSVTTLIDILEALGTSPIEFFKDDEAKFFFSEDDYFENTNEELAHSISWIVPNAQRFMMEPIIITINPDGKSEEIPPFEGETFGYVLKGFVDLYIGDKVQKLKRGETFYFEAKANHHLENNSRTEAKVLWISSPPNF